MLPPKCFSCGKFLADIQLEYEDGKKEIDANVNLTLEQKRKQKKELLNKLHIVRICCRDIVLTYCDTIHVII